MATGSEKYSLTVSQTLDNLGYSQDMLEHRRRHYDMNDIMLNKTKKSIVDGSIKLMTAGSKAEGLTAPCESDVDVMYIVNYMICVNDPSPFMDQTDLTIFETEIQEEYPGYTRLKLIKLGIDSPIDTRDSLFQESDGEWFLSSEFFEESIIKIYKENLKRSTKKLSKEGPACNIVDNAINTPYDNMDFVNGLHCVCPDLLNAYLNRPRKHGWPTQQILDKVSKVDAHVVPVGNKDSQDSYKEWRICFTKAEITLIRSLNNTQIKLYILLKMVCKSIIKKKFPAITSYVMKNIVLWMVETNPQELFTDKLLLERLIQSLYFLKIRVESGFVPSYMIPDRNLLAGRIDGIEQEGLVTLLTSLIKAGPYMLLQCPRLHRGLAMMYSQPNEVATAARTRNNIEKTYLLLYERKLELKSKGFTSDQTDPEFVYILTILWYMVIPNWRTLEQEGEDYVKIYYQKLKKLLS